MKPTCETCRYFEKPGTNYGYCHRMPPSWIGDRHEFAIVIKDTWCGEHEPKEHQFKPYSIMEDVKP